MSTILQLAKGYAIISNGGYEITPTLIRDNSNEKIIEAIQELKKNKKLMIPFRYIKKYDKLAFDVIDSEYPSLKINNNIVYFPTNTNRRDILGAVKTHFIEQDVESPINILLIKLKYKDTQLF